MRMMYYTLRWKKSGDFVVRQDGRWDKASNSIKDAFLFSAPEYAKKLLYLPEIGDKAEVVEVELRLRVIK